MSGLIGAVMQWAGEHAYLAGLIVALIACAESLAFVGLVVPGAVMMLGAGALVGAGVLGFWSTLVWAVAGAVLGDGVSYWLGHRYRDRLRGLWPLRRHPEWVSRGEEFIHRHGGKSILFGRFAGPVRPIVPVVAGMLGMRPSTFYTMNVVSALAWAPAHLLPGMAFGASLALAGEVAARLAALLALLVAMMWLVVWITRRLFQVLPPRAAQMTRRLLAWSNRHPRVNRLIGGLYDPERSEPNALLVLGALLITSGWLFLGVLEDVVTGDPLVRADQGVYRLLQGLRTPWGDRLMVSVTELGDGVVLGFVVASVLAWFLWQRNWRTAAYWALAAGFGQVAATVLKLTLQRSRPIAIDDGVLSAYAFPSGHATMNMVMYGFLSVLVARNVAPPRRWVPYATAALLIGAIALSRLYLGVHWFSDVVGGLSLGLALVTLLAIAYRRHPPTVLPRGLPLVAVLALCVAGGWHVGSTYSTDLQRYAPRVTVRHLGLESWWRDDWRSLPTYRQDLEGELEQPLNVQWAGTLAAVRQRLVSQGWREPVPLAATSALRWLLPAPTLAELPVLPQVHDGRDESLLMVRSPDGGPAQEGATSDPRSRQLVLRLWNTGIVLDPGAVPLWVGSVSLQEMRRVLFLRLPLTTRAYDAPLALLAQSINKGEQRSVQRSTGAGGQESSWSGTVVLIREP